MIKFFQKIRYDLMKKNKTGHYFRYAIGEIVLVVIGILIALQINNWNEHQKNLKKERKVLIKLETDLTADLVKLDTLIAQFSRAIASKDVFTSLYYPEDTIESPLVEHFKNQYIEILGDFNPNTITIDELKSSGSVNLITNDSLSRELFALYNNYDDLSTKLNIGMDKAQIMLNYMSAHVLFILNPTQSELVTLLNDKFFVNQMDSNYVVGRLMAVEETYSICNRVLQQVKNELND